MNSPSAEGMMMQVVKMLPITPERWQRAWELFVRYSDKDFSFTDCTSFAVMNELKLPAALAFDHHSADGLYHAP
ncbi:MAG: hypothetical protein QME76_08520 [Bacillota bacterium]|nr:hypothetical protein [Bacillota bacterium]